MSKKRLFQVFDEMNVNDEKNNTAFLGCCYAMVEATTAKGGGHVMMGVPAEAITKMFLGEVQPILILLDKKEYHRLKDQLIVDEENEKMKSLSTEWRPLLEEVLSKHESGLLPDRFIYEKIKRFLHG